MKTLMLVTVCMLISACNESGSKEAQVATVHPIFALWTSDVIPATVISGKVDLSSAQYGTSSVQATVLMSGVDYGVCTCNAVITGDAVTGTVNVGDCTLVSGNASACTAGLNSFDSIEYDFSSYGVRSAVLPIDYN